MAIRTQFFGVSEILNRRLKSATRLRTSQPAVKPQAVESVKFRYRR